MTSKFQITIPKRIREKIPIKPGEKVYLDVQDDRITIKAVTTKEGVLERLYGTMDKKFDAVKEIHREKKKKKDLR